MAIFKRGKTWWVRFTAPNGKQIRCTAQTSDRKAALEYHDKIKAEYWRVHQLGVKPKYTWQEAVERWLDETEHKASRADDLKIFRRLHMFLFDIQLDEINRDLIDEIVKTRKKDDGVANATINRLLQLLRAVLRRARDEWEWIDKIPSIKLLPESKRRVRWLTPTEVEKLSETLPSHLKDMMLFSLATGLRESNVTHLEWSQIDFERQCAWIHPDQSKSKKAIAVPLNNDALSILEARLGKHSERVFTFRGQPIQMANTRAWRNALKKVGIEDFRWHDLRHTWATWHVQNGTPLSVLQELGGWSSYEMVRRYAHFSAAHLASYADRVSQNKIFSTNLAHPS